jgi:type IV fimbrial biogenesis protein FimT
MLRRESGFTLFELLLTLLLIAVITGLGMPMLAQSSAHARINAEVDALFHAVHLARKESIMRRQVVSICPSPDGRQCSPGTDWTQGWILFNNRDRDDPPAIDAGEPVLQVHRSGENLLISANRRGFTFRSTQKRATNGTLVVCDATSRVAPKALVVSYTGRPRVATSTADGESYSCIR